MRRFLTTSVALAVALLAILAAGFALRAHKLDAQSLWYDEGNSARIAERSLQLIVEGAGGDIHPPLYYIVLHFWRAVFGDSQGALRLLSVVCGVLLVLFTFLASQALFDTRTALIAAVLAAASPFAVYYSQEARMYVLLALEAALSTWALLRLASHRLPLISNLWLLASFILATAAGLYTQYAYPFVMVAQGVCVLIWLAAAKPSSPWKARGRDLLAYAGMNAVAIALFLPWLPIAVRQVTSWTVMPQSYELGPAVLDAYRWLVTGRTLALDQAAAPLLGFGILALIGILPFHPLPLDGQIQRRIWQSAASDQAVNPLSAPARGKTTAADWLPGVFAFVLLALPIALLLAFKLYRESYLKFLLTGVMPLCALTAHGIIVVATVWLPTDPRRLARGVSSALAIGLTGILVATVLPSLRNLYDNPAYARDDYRGIARLIQAGAQPGDAVLFDAPNQWEVFTYYHRPGELAPPIPLAYHPASDSTVEAELRPIARQYRRLFVLYYGERESDPDSRIERWLSANTFKAGEQWVGNIRLAVYASQAPSATQPISATFGNAMLLETVTIDLADRQIGALVPLQLDWRVLAKVAARYKVFVHIGAADAAPVAQNDAEPVGGYKPTNDWQPGETVVDRRAVWLKPGTPPGRYGVYIGVYDGDTGARLPVSTDCRLSTVVGDRLWVGDITVQP